MTAASTLRRFDELCDRYCEESLTAAESRELETLALADRALVQRFVDVLFVHGLLTCDLGARSIIGRDELLGPALELLNDPHLRFATVPQSAVEPSAVEQSAAQRGGDTKPGKNRRRGRWMLTGTVVAGLLLGVTLWWTQPPAGAPVVVDGGNLPPTLPSQNDPEKGHPADDRLVVNGTVPADRGTGETPASGMPGAAMGLDTSPVVPPAGSPVEVVQLTPPAAPPGTGVSSLETRPPVVAAAVPPRQADRTIVAAIDAEIVDGLRGSDVTPSPQADDYEWLRRVSLDLIGRIPTARELTAFAADTDTQKRATTVERLLTSPEFSHDQASRWSSLLVGRDASLEVESRGVRDYLVQSLEGGRGWDVVVRDLITAEGDPRENGAAGFLVAHLNNDAVPATGVVCRTLLGRQIQCAQCHNHPLNDWTQQDFWELNSFFKQVRTQTDQVANESRTRLISVSVGGPTYFETRSGLMQVAYPTFAGEPVDPGKETSRRTELSRLLFARQSERVSDAFVNRVWEQLFGFSFTRPVDDMGPHNPPTHPELLQLLSEQFRASQYDVRALYRWICNTSAYGCTSQETAENLTDRPETGEPPLFSRVYVKEMSPEQLFNSLQVAAGRHPVSQGEAGAPARGKLGRQLRAFDRSRDQWVQEFVTDFQTDENDEFDLLNGTIPMAIHMMNGELVDGVVTAHTNAIAAAMQPDLRHRERIDLLALSAVSRPASERELSQFSRAIRERVGADWTSDAGRDRLRAVLEDVLWAYVNAAEFVLVH